MGKKKSKKSTKKKNTAVIKAVTSQTPVNLAEIAKSEPVTQTPESSSTQKAGYFSTFKNYLVEAVQDFNNSLDAEKVAFVKVETKKILKGGIYYVAAIVSVVAILIVLDLHSNHRILPNTKAGTIDVSYMPVEEAKGKIMQQIDEYLSKPQQFIYKDKSISISNEELGITVAKNDITEHLPEFSFKTDSTAALLTSAFREKTVIIKYDIDDDKLVSIIHAKFGVSDKRARNATFVLDGKNYVISPESAGYIVDLASVKKQLADNIENLKNAPLELEFIPEKPRVVSQTLESQKDTLLGKLNSLIFISDGDNTLKFKPIEHMDAIEFAEATTVDLKALGKWPVSINMASAAPDVRSAINTEIAIRLNPSKIDSYLTENLLSEIEVPTSPAKIYKDENGKIIIEGKGENGRSVSRKQLAEAISLAINNNINKVPVPVQIAQAPLDIAPELQDIGIKQLLATGHSAYYGSPANRMFNINLGVSKYNGIIIAPGQEFSFNGVLGNVDSESGFKPEKVIKGNKIELEIGGGICQVSTTMYRAALLAGFPVTDRKPHSWKVSYYGQSMGDGLDATIYPGVSDLKFINDTPGNVLVQSYTDGSEAYFKFYGTSDGRITTLDGPFGGGLSFRWTRTITKDGQTTKEDIWSKYKPIPPPEPVKQPESQPVTTAASNVD